MAMLSDRIEGKWIDAFSETFARCGVKAGDSAAILSETQSRAPQMHFAQRGRLPPGGRAPPPRAAAAAPGGATVPHRAADAAQSLPGPDPLDRRQRRDRRARPGGLGA